MCVWVHVEGRGEEVGMARDVLEGRVCGHVRTCEFMTFVLYTFTWPRVHKNRKLE